MEDQKRILAEKIRQKVAELAPLIEEADQLDLTVQINTSKQVPLMGNVPTGLPRAYADIIEIIKTHY